MKQVPMSAAEFAVYHAIKNLGCDKTAIDIASHIGCGERTVRYALDRLKTAQMIERRGANKNGRYIILRDWTPDAVIK